MTLKIWRQKDAKTKGQFETVKINDVSPDMSFLEMLDIVNEEQMKQGKEGKKEVQGWRHHRDRTVARRRIPGYP